MAFFTFQSPAAEVLTGGAEADTFIASNFNLNAGDRAFGNANDDRLEYFADLTLTATAGNTRTFSGFILDSVETVSVTNDSAVTLVFDLSSSTFTRPGGGAATSDIRTLEVENSTNAVVFDQVGLVTGTAIGQAGSLARILLDRQTNAATSNVTVGYQAGLLAGANDVVNVELQATNAGVVRIGSSTGVINAATNTGVETVNLTISNGASVVQQLDTDLTNLTISASPNFVAGDGFTINTALNTTVRSITSSFQGNITLSWANNAVGVTYVGSQTGTGTNRLFAGNGNDTITTFAGDDVIVADALGGAGNDTINAGEGRNVVRTGGGTNSVTTGAGSDTVYAQGIDTVNTGEGADIVDMTAATRLTLNAGGGNDFVIGTGGSFDASAGVNFDTLNMGVNDFDILVVDAGTVDAQYRQVSNLDAVAIATAGTTTLQGNNIGGGGTNFAQAAGINTVYLISGSAGNDVLNAASFSTALTVVSFSSDAALVTTDADGRATAINNRFNNFGAGGGSDTVTTGSASDQFLFRGNNNLDDTDRLNGGGQAGATTDSLVLNGNTTLTAAAAGAGQFTNIEFIALESARSGGNRANPAANVAGNIYNLTLTNANAPSVGQRLTIAGNDLQAAGAAVRDINGVNTAGVLTSSENATINAAAVTAYSLNITTGAGNDTVTTSQAGDFVQTQGGSDTITDGIGNDVIDPGLGNDTVILTAGNNTVGDVGGNNTVVLGTGNDTVAFLGTGADVGNDIVIADANLTAADVLVDRGGIDTVRVAGRNYVDGNFAGIASAVAGTQQGFEILTILNGFTTQVGANAQRAGFRTFIALDPAASTIDAGQYTTAIRVDLGNGQVAAGNDVVTLGNITALATQQSSVAIFNDTQVFAPGVALDFIGGGDTGTDITDLTANANLVLAGNGDNQVIGGSGTDVLRVNGGQLTNADQFRGGAGLDVVQLNNFAGVVNATVNLSLVTSVERYEFTAANIQGPGNDAANHTLRFGTAPDGTVTTLTPITIDTSRLTDTLDSTTVTLDASLQDADFQFNILGGSVGTNVVKENVFFNNNINFEGGTGIDNLRIFGGDLGSTVRFNGGANLDDSIILIAPAAAGGQVSRVTDDGFVGVRGVEILTADNASLNAPTVQATLGQQAGLSGLRIVRGTAGSDNVLFDPAFSSAFRSVAQNAALNNVFTVELGTGGNDVINGAATDIAFNFVTPMNGLNGDALSGGSTANDVLTILTGTTPGQTGDATNVTGVERINVTLPDNAIDNDTTLTIDTTLAEVNGGTQTITATAAVGRENSNLNDFILNAQAATANLVVTSAGGFDEIRTGSGVDIINTFGGSDIIVSGTGVDTINAGLGNDTINAGEGNDIINAGVDGAGGAADSDRVVGGAGQDQINGGDGGDLIRGWIDSDTIGIGLAGLNPGNENDTINGGAGADIIEGGAGLDTLTGGDGADIFLYRNRADSTLAVAGRDVITDFVSGVDRIDAVSVRDAAYAPGSQVRFAGNFGTFGDAQSVINANDGILDVVYDYSSNILYFDLNDDGSLDGNDLQIVVNTTGFAIAGVAGEFGLQAQDVLAGVATVGGGNYAAFDLAMSTVPA